MEAIIISQTAPKFTDLLRSPTLLLAFGFGSGLAPKAPGTFGTIAAIPLWLLLIQLSAPLYWILLTVATIAGVYICSVATTKLKVHDHPGIVWDEFVGFWIAMSMVTPQLGSIICGFLLFRFFDIVKPWPIGWLDKKVNGGLGIMIDDIVAGVYTAVLLSCINFLGYL